MIAKVSIFLLCLTLASASNLVERCSTLSCVHASAAMITKINYQIDPCEDFYEFACGQFKEEQHTPDEKTTVDTIALMGDKLIEFLLTLLEQPSREDASKLHALARKFYRSCMDYQKVNQRGKQPLSDILNVIGQWPLLLGKDWDDSQWDWEKAILKFRKFISKKEDNIFRTNKESTNEIDPGIQLFNDDKEDYARVEKSLKELIKSISINFRATNSSEVTKDIDDLIEFEKKLDEYQRKFQVYRVQFDKQIKDKKSGFVKVPELQKMYKYVIYLDLLAPFVLSNTSKISSEELSLDFNVKYYEFLKNTPKRTLANYVGWKIVQSSLFFLDFDMRQTVLDFEKNAFGKEDYEQRWILCANIVTNVAPVAIGHLYTSSYFAEKDKAKADELVDFILQEYIETTKNSTWMDENTKQTALDKTSKMRKYIGYHVKLRTQEAETFYDELPPAYEESFLEMGLSFLILSTDREFKRLHAKKKVDEDWTKYSKPATVNAFYSSRDNSIQFPAAILQSPNFDKDRPPFMNFGAIGSIIGHEITHAFDDQASTKETWSEASKTAFEGRVRCIVDQYSSYRVPEVEEFFQDDKIGKFYLNGNLTQKEDVADCGGVKLALKAFKRFEHRYPKSEIVPIGLQNYDKDKLFFLSFAQTFCSVERPTRMKNKVENDNHSLDRFRVIGPLSNLNEFAEAWSCAEGSPMNPKKKCALW